MRKSSGTKRCVTRNLRSKNEGKLMSRRWNRRVDDDEESERSQILDAYLQTLMDSLYEESVELKRQIALRQGKDWRENEWLQDHVAERADWDENVLSK